MLQNVALRPKSARIARCGDRSSWVEAMITFEKGSNPKFLCSGFISIVDDGAGGWKIWLLRTMVVTPMTTQAE